MSQSTLRGAGIYQRVKALVQKIGLLMSNINLEGLAPFVVTQMNKEIWKLEKDLYYTPKWRKIKRYRMFERLNKLQEDKGLIEHVLMEDN